MMKQSTKRIGTIALLISSVALIGLPGVSTAADEGIGMSAWVGRVTSTSNEGVSAGTATCALTATTTIQGRLQVSYVAAANVASADQVIATVVSCRVFDEAGNEFGRSVAGPGYAAADAQSAPPPAWPVGPLHMCVSGYAILAVGTFSIAESCTAAGDIVEV